MYRGKNYVEKFVEHIEEEAIVWNIFTEAYDRTYRCVEERTKKSVAKKCLICLKEFNDPRNKKVRDPCL